MNDALSQIEVAANRVRSEFFGTLRELDRRRRSIMDVRRQVREHAGILVVAGVVVASGVLLATTVAIVRRRSRQTRLRRERFQGLLRAWKHPDRVAATDKWDPLMAVAGKVLATVGAAVGSQLVRRTAQSIVRSGTQHP